MSPRALTDRSPATRLPVARVAVDISLAHLDRPFDYLVTESQSAAARPGVRVRVRFAGQLVDGFVLARLDRSDHDGRLSRLERVLGSEPVLSPAVAALARDVADRYAGTMADVLRLAVPARHATTERGARPAAAADPAPTPVTDLDRYDGGSRLVSRLATGDSPRAVWTVLPGDWPSELAATVAAVHACGRGAVVVLPDARDLARVDAALHSALGEGRHVALSAGLGPAERYRRFLAISRGDVRVAVGTRACVWAPVANLGLVVVWDDGDDLHHEPRAPYCHVREVATLRATREHAACLVAGHAMTAEGALLVESGWAELVAPTRDGRLALPQLRTAGGDDELARDPAARAARLPSRAWEIARRGLAQGPVLVQVPRRGYQPALACARCRTPARCAVCAGPLARQSGGALACRWCGAPAPDWACPECGHDQLRAVVVGASRTAEELGRAFPGVPVRTSGAGNVLTDVDASPALVVTTPGAEPVADGGYAAAVLLDGWALLGRPDLRAGEEALRRWLAAASLVRPAAAGGVVVVVAPEQLRPVQALLRWQPRWHAERELEDRTALHLPPAGRLAAVTGQPFALAEFLGALELPATAEVLGPVPVVGDGRDAADPHAADTDAGDPDAAAPEQRALIRVPRRDGRELSERLKVGLATRSARKARDVVTVTVDPATVG